MCAGRPSAIPPAVARPLPSPMVWARYATRAKAEEAMESQRFGAARWSVEDRPTADAVPYPWALVDNGPGEENGAPRH